MICQFLISLPVQVLNVKGHFFNFMTQILKLVQKNLVNSNNCAGQLCSYVVGENLVIVLKLNCNPQALIRQPCKIKENVA